VYCIFHLRRSGTRPEAVFRIRQVLRRNGCEGQQREEKHIKPTGSALQPSRSILRNIYDDISVKETIETDDGSFDSCENLQYSDWYAESESVLLVKFLALLG